MGGSIGKLIKPLPACCLSELELHRIIRCLPRLGVTDQVRVTSGSDGRTTHEAYAYQEKERSFYHYMWGHWSNRFLKGS